MSANSRPLGVGSHRRAKWFCFLVALVTVGFLVCLFYWTRADVFEVNGVPFRIWVAQHPDFEIQDPLAAVGTNAIPHLVRIIREPEESAPAYRARTWIWKHLPHRVQSRFQRWYPVPRWQLKRTALFGLRFLGPEAESALPEVLRIGHAETNRMVRGTALTASLAIAPESPDTFHSWREEWEHTNYFSRRDLAVYLHSVRRPVHAAISLLLAELRQNPDSVTVIETFEFFGEYARPAVPYVRENLRSQTYRGNMISLLRRFGPIAGEAAPDLAEILKEDSPDLVAGALDALKRIGPDARSALPAIRPLLTNNDPLIRMLAASALAHIEKQPDVAIPLLLQGLEGQLPGVAKSTMKVDIRQDLEGLVARGPEAAAILLGELGPDAQSALPALERRLGDNSEWVRLAAAEAIWRISRDAEKALPVLLRILQSQLRPSQGRPHRSNDYTLIRAIELTEDMGPRAGAAIRDLEQLRAHSMVARRAVNAALERIKPGP